jgi:hypothetical protein
MRSRDSLASIGTGYGLDERGVGVTSPNAAKNFLFSTSSTPVLGFTQPPIQWVPEVLFPGVKRPGVKLTTHLQPVPRSRIYGSIHPLRHTPSWRSAYLVKHRDNVTSFTCIHDLSRSLTKRAGNLSFSLRITLTYPTLLENTHTCSF